MRVLRGTSARQTLMAKQLENRIPNFTRAQAIAIPLPDLSGLVVLYAMQPEFHHGCSFHTMSTSQRRRGNVVAPLRHNQSASASVLQSRETSNELFFSALTKSR